MDTSITVAESLRLFIHLPQGAQERCIRVQNRVSPMDREGLGNCTNHCECEAACPAGIHDRAIAGMNRDLFVSELK